MKLAIACAVLVACGCGGSEPPQPGAFTLGWSITLDSAPATCEDVAGISVVVTIDELATDSTAFPCIHGDGATAPHEPGSYEILVELRAGDESRLFAFPPVEGEIVDGPVDLGDFVFAIGTACDASTCPNGCCNGAGDCIEPQTDTTCGRGGVTCSNCTLLGQVCNQTDGLCID